MAEVRNNRIPVAVLADAPGDTSEGPQIAARPVRFRFRRVTSTCHSNAFGMTSSLDVRMIVVQLPPVGFSRTYQGFAHPYSLLLQFREYRCVVVHMRPAGRMRPCGNLTEGDVWTNDSKHDAVEAWPQSLEVR
jgi:hypothetical protein